MKLGWLVVFAVAGCIDAGSVPCGDETYCPTGTVCVHATETVTVCAAPDRGECIGIADGELCGDRGRCYDEFCLPIVCGDRVVDPTEACDLGDTVSGDGCSADCSSDERCGTGEVDPAQGEACDDGNLRAHDGCSTTCELETPRWGALRSGTPQRDDPTLVFDPVRGRVVMFGGSDLEGGTFEWTGLGWIERETQFSPQLRTGQAAAYDVARQNLVLHGGSAGGTAGFGDTWVLGNDGWTLMAANAPSIRTRANHAMAYDPIHERVVMFGGRRGGNVSLILDEGWAWDGQAWTAIPDGPSARYGHVMAFDPGRGTIILHGGMTANGLVDDTWEWNGTAWTQLQVQGPPARSGAALTTYRGGLLLYGGTLADNKVDGTVWRWNGTAWSSLGAGSAGLRTGAGMATDFLRDRIVLFGGRGADAEVWEWAGASFAVATVVSPGPVVEGAAAFDSRRGHAIVVGGSGTYAMVDGAWSEVTASTPASTDGHAVAYDGARDEIVSFGGEPLAQTWVLADSGGARTWIQRAPSQSPPWRGEAGMAYDTARSRTVLFGGEDGFNPLDDTWEWDGTTWHEITTITRPSARHSHVLGYDPIRRVTLLFGGSAGGTAVADTWLWDGIAWTQVPVTGAQPIPREDAAIAWNPGRKRLTLVGGFGGLLGELDDAWEWDGAAWTPVPTELRPPPTSRAMLMQTTDATGLVLFGGVNMFGPTSDVWRLRWEGIGPDEQCGGRIDRDGDGAAGCDDPDCWTRCTPACAPGLSCAADAPRCGDGAANPRETCQLCPEDAGACPACGDLLCEAPETIATCPGDCSP